MSVDIEPHIDHRIPTLLGNLHVSESGQPQGPVMVCWPSLLMDGRMWQAQAEHYGDRYRVLRIDPPGHGRSQALTRGFTLEECAHSLRQVLDALAVDECVLIGNSWGGMMGGVFAAQYPERLRAAVLMNCTAAAVGHYQRFEFLAMTGLLSRLRRMPRWLVHRAVVAFAGKTTERTQPEVVEQIRTTVLSADPQSVHWAIRSVVPHRRDRHAQMRDVRCPVLVVAGDEDRTFPVAETRRMADAIPGSRFVVLRGVGHLAGLEAPARVNQVVDAFLEECVPQK